MSKRFYENFPKINYKLYDTTKNVVNISYCIKLSDLLKNNALVYYPYVLQENETPDIVAYNYYDDSNLFWVILLSNDMMNVREEWYRSSIDFDRYIEDKYGSVREANRQFKYYTGTNLEVDYDTWTNLTGTQSIQKYRKSMYDIEIDLNEEKRHIKLLGKNYLPQVIREISRVF